MTATAPSTAPEANLMDQTSDMRTGPPGKATTAAPATAGVRSRRLAILGDNPLLTLVVTGAAALLTVLGTVAVALLLFILNDHSNRLDRLEDTVADGFAAQSAKIDEVDRRLTAQIGELDRKLTAQIGELDRKLTAQIGELDRKLTAQVGELDRKLTALIAALNMTDELDAALEGRLLGLEEG